MRILFVAPYVPSFIRVRPLHFLRALGQRHEIVVLAAAPSGELAHAAHLRAFCQQVEVTPLRLQTSLRQMLRAGMRGWPLQAAVCRSPVLLRRLQEILASQRFDLVHVEHLRAGHVVEAIPDDLPRVYDSVDCISLLLERTRRASHSHLQRILATIELARTRRYESHLLSRFDHTIVSAAEDRDVLSAIAPTNRVTVVPNGVDLEYFRPVAARREPAHLVFSGKMSYHANVTAVLHFVQKILPLVRRMCPEVRLTVVGSNPPGSIRALARDPAIRVTGYVPDIRPFLGQAAVAICPVTVKVGIQNKILEAMAMGTPVVASLAGVAGLEAEPGRDLLVAASPSEFAERVCQLIDDPRFAERLGQSGRRYVETNHRWEVNTDRLEYVYSEARQYRHDRLSQASSAIFPI